VPVFDLSEKNLFVTKTRSNESTKKVISSVAFPSNKVVSMKCRISNKEPQIIEVNVPGDLKKEKR